MNKNLIITLGLIAALSAATVSAFAESTIYTDGIGRMHFLGKDAAHNTESRYNYSNSAEQDLTRKLYERGENGMVNDTSYDQHPLKNYENTFLDSRFGTSNVWRTKYANGADNSVIKAKDTVKSADLKNKEVSTSGYHYSTSVPDDGDAVDRTVGKKHWWNRR